MPESLSVVQDRLRIKRRCAVPRYYRRKHAPAQAGVPGSIVGLSTAAGRIPSVNTYDGAKGVAQQQRGIPGSGPNTLWASVAQGGRFAYTGQAWIS